MNESQNIQKKMHDTATYTPVSRRSDEARNTRPQKTASQARMANTARKASHPEDVKPSVVLGGVPYEEVKAPRKKRSFPLNSEPPRVRTIRSQTKTPVPVALFFALLVCTGLFMYMIYNYVEINEQTEEVKDLQVRLEDLTMRQQSLQIQLENKNDLNGTLNYEDLGMVKTDDVEKSYLDAAGEDTINVIKVPGEDEEEVGAITVLLNAIAQNFRDFAEYID